MTGRIQIKYVPISSLVPYENNPRKNDSAVDAVANSIKTFGFKVPIVIDDKNVIVAGHTRYKASKKLGLDEVPVIIADDLSEEQIRAFRLADNKVGELSDWDYAKLDAELQSLAMEMGAFGFEDLLDEVEKPNPYTQKVSIPKYIPMEETPPTLSELVDLNKTESLMSEIDASDVPDDVKSFLKVASYRHAVFDYSRIAEYYCHATPEVQDLMERSALVIIDFEKAIEYGYTALKGRLDEMLEEDRHARRLRSLHTHTRSRRQCSHIRDAQALRVYGENLHRDR